MDIKKISAQNIIFFLILILFLTPILGRLALPLFIIGLFYLVLRKYFQRVIKSTDRKTIKRVNLNNLKNMEYIKKIIWPIVVILLLWLFFGSIVIIQAGETGVYSLFGKVSDQELHSGFHLIIPIAHVTDMSIRTEEYTMSVVNNEGKKEGPDAIEALTKEGLNVGLDITVLYHLEEDKASDVYRTVGLNYEEKIIRPSIRSTIREIIAQYSAKDIYSVKRQEATDKILSSLQKSLEERGIVIEQVMLRNVQLPAGLAKAIQEKLQAEQEAEKYDFILAKEKKEKQRKIIAAEGQRDSQKIINQSLSSNYLYYLYISSLKDRQGTIYVPTSPSTGMPLFKDLGK